MANDFFSDVTPDAPKAAPKTAKGAGADPFSDVTPDNPVKAATTTSTPMPAQSARDRAMARLTGKTPSSLLPMSPDQVRKHPLSPAPEPTSMFNTAFPGPVGQGLTEAFTGQGYGLDTRLKTPIDPNTKTPDTFGHGFGQGINPFGWFAPTAGELLATEPFTVRKTPTTPAEFKKYEDSSNHGPNYTPTLGNLPDRLLATMTPHFMDTAHEAYNRGERGESTKGMVGRTVAPLAAMAVPKIASTTAHKVFPPDIALERANDLLRSNVGAGPANFQHGELEDLGSGTIGTTKSEGRLLKNLEALKQNTHNMVSDQLVNHPNANVQVNPMDVLKPELERSATALKVKGDTSSIDNLRAILNDKIRQLGGGQTGTLDLQGLHELRKFIDDLGPSFKGEANAETTFRNLRNALRTAIDHQAPEVTGLNNTYHSLIEGVKSLKDKIHLSDGEPGSHATLFGQIRKSLGGWIPSTLVRSGIADMLQRYGGKAPEYELGVPPYQRTGRLANPGQYPGPIGPTMPPPPATGLTPTGGGPTGGPNTQPPAGGGAGGGLSYTAKVVRPELPGATVGQKLLGPGPEGTAAEPPMPTHIKEGGQVSGHDAEGNLISGQLEKLYPKMVDGQTQWFGTVNDMRNGRAVDLPADQLFDRLSGPPKPTGGKGGGGGGKGKPPGATPAGIAGGPPVGPDQPFPGNRLTSLESNISSRNRWADISDFIHPEQGSRPGITPEEWSRFRNSMNDALSPLEPFTDKHGVTHPGRYEVFDYASGATITYVNTLEEADTLTKIIEHSFKHDGLLPDYEQSGTMAPPAGNSPAGQRGLSFEPPAGPLDSYSSMDFAKANENKPDFHDAIRPDVRDYHDRVMERPDGWRPIVKDMTAHYPEPPAGMPRAEKAKYFKDVMSKPEDIALVRDAVERLADKHPELTKLVSRVTIVSDPAKTATGWYTPDAKGSEIHVNLPVLRKNIKELGLAAADEVLMHEITHAQQHFHGEIPQFTPPSMNGPDGYMRRPWEQEAFRAGSNYTGLASPYNAKIPMTPDEVQNFPVWRAKPWHNQPRLSTPYQEAPKPKGK